MQIRKRITKTLLTAIVLAGLNANAQFPFAATGFYAAPHKEHTG